MNPIKTEGELMCSRRVTDEMKILPINRKIYHTVGKYQISNRKIAERGKMDSHITQIHERSLPWLGTGTSIKSDGDILGLWALLVSHVHCAFYITTQKNLLQVKQKANLITVIKTIPHRPFPKFIRKTDTKYIHTYIR